ncbi:serine/threonine protein kinase [Tepidiphilus baoligensis]|uniref:Protein kinase n=1 Tax=Tepidiphilus baoligensis TaxID=2698687 RepID=A0ABX1QHD0_9PROT|nr:protein kinase [Tepidiphilus baoligensis]
MPVGWLVEGYRIVDLLAKGGFSFVYRARDREGKTVAIKEYLPHTLARREEGEIEPEILPDCERAFLFGLKCFFEEGRSLARINHPNVIRVLNFFRANQTVYMVMQYEEGRTLLQYVRQKKGGLREVHTHKLLHLDLKPANIYLRRNGDPVLIDFGSARQSLSSDQAWVRTMFTPGYAPPEQLSGKRELIGPWTDLYSFGATLYTCVTGQAPPRAEARQEKDDLPQRLAPYRERYTPELIDLIVDLMQLEPEQRPQSAYAVQKVLSAYVPFLVAATEYRSMMPSLHEGA